MNAENIGKKVEARYRNSKAVNLLMLLCESDIGVFVPDTRELYENLRQLYEIEYKYSMLKNRPFKGIPKRKENIIKFLEQKADRIIKIAAAQLDNIYLGWLDRHAITKPRVWAEARLEDNEDEGFKVSLDIIDSEYSRYSSLDIGDTLRDISGVEKKLPNLSSFVREAFYDFVNANQDEIDRLRDTQDEIDGKIKEFEDKIATFRKDQVSLEVKIADAGNDEEKKQKLEDQLEEILKDTAYIRDVKLVDLANEFDEIVEEIKELQKAIDDRDDYNISEMIEELLSITGQEFMSFLADSYNGNEHSLLLELYEHVVFPVWFGYWKPRGIVQTRKRIEKAEKELKKFIKEGFKDHSSFSKLNEIINITHQTGSMIDYVEEVYPEVNYTSLKKLSNLDTKPFDKDLKKIGVEL